MTGKAAFVHDPSLEDYGFGEGHPFNPARIRMAIELCEALGLLEGYSLIESEPATDEDLRTAHSPVYVRRVKEASRSEGEREKLQQYGLDTQDGSVSL